MKFYILGIIFLLSIGFQSCFIHINTDHSEAIKVNDSTVYKKFNLNNFIGSVGFTNAENIPVQELNVSDIRKIFPYGKLTWVVLWASYCGPCHEKMPSYMDVYKKYKQKGLNLVLVCDNYESEYVKKYLFKIGYDKPAYILSYKNYGRKIARKWVGFRNELCFACDDKEPGFPAHYIFTPDSKLVYYNTWQTTAISVDSVCENILTKNSH